MRANSEACCRQVRARRWRAMFHTEGPMSTRPRRPLVTFIALAFLALAASPGVVSAQTAPATRAAQDPLTAIIAVDPQVRVGRLPNGLQYFVRANGQPQGRAEL